MKPSVVSPADIDLTPGAGNGYRARGVRDATMVVAEEAIRSTRNPPRRALATAPGSPSRPSARDSSATSQRSATEPTPASTASSSRRSPPPRHVGGLEACRAHRGARGRSLRRLLGLVMVKLGPRRTHQGSHRDGVR